MAAQVLALPTYYLAQPLADFRVVYVIIVTPALVARVVRRINIDALDPSLIPGQQSLECLQIVPRIIMLSLCSALYVYCSSSTRQGTSKWWLTTLSFPIHSSVGISFSPIPHYSKTKSASVNIPLFFMRLFKHDLKVAFTTLFAASRA